VGEVWQVLFNLFLCWVRCLEEMSLKFLQDCRAGVGCYDAVKCPKRDDL